MPVIGIIPIVIPMLMIIWNSSIPIMPEASRQLKRSRASKMITIPFNAWSVERINAGVKNATARYKKYGRVGDTFLVAGQLYRILEIKHVKLETLINDLYETEGATSPAELSKVWTEIHPAIGVREQDDVWYHKFEWLKSIE